jgi:hypothetical protein
MLATALSGLAVAAACTVIVYGARLAKAGRSQVDFTGSGRLAAQKIARLVEQAKAVGVGSNGLTLVGVDMASSRIYFDTGDGSVDSVEDNRLMYAAGLTNGSPVRVLCTYVSPLGAEPMFSMAASNSASVRVVFHVGDGTNVQSESFSRTGSGYQGVEVRLSASPRNLQLWYN